MSTSHTTGNGSILQWVIGQPDLSGEFFVQVVGLPELHATAPTRAEAIEKIRALLQALLASGNLMAIEVPCANPVLHFSGHLDPHDPIEEEFVDELARQRREDYEQSLREETCPSSSSTPTT